MRLLPWSFLALMGCGAISQTPTGLDEFELTDEQLLGKRLFEDRTLSEPAGQACVSCHDPRRAFSGTNGEQLAPTARGSRPQVFGTRNVPTAMYASFSPAFRFVPTALSDGGVDFTPTGGQFWDGRAASLQDQAQGPFLNPREMNNADAAAVVAKVRASLSAPLFRQVYGDEALDDVDTAFGLVAQALAAYELTPRFHPFSSRFDAFLRGEEQLAPEEQRGFALFMDPEKGNCVSCHVGVTSSRAPTDWLFTDFTFDALGLPRNARIAENADPASFDLGLCARAGLGDGAPDGVDLEAFCGAFKVPTLRNIELTAPYGHNGVFAELRDVVRFYVTRDTNPDDWYPSGAPFDDLPPRLRGNVNTSEVPYDRKRGEQPRLSDEEIDDVVAFLLTLTDR